MLPRDFIQNILDLKVERARRGIAHYLLKPGVVAHMLPVPVRVGVFGMVGRVLPFHYFLLLAKINDNPEM
jgi:hypothetical protein